MNARAILAIARKDILDAIKNTYILFAFLLPVGMSLLFRVMLPSDSARPLALVVYDPEGSQLVKQAQANPAIRLIPAGSAAEVPGLVKGEVTGGMALPTGFDAAVAAGKTPDLPYYFNGGRSATELAALRRIIEESLRVMAGQSLPAHLVAADVSGTAEGAQSFDLSRYYLILLLVMGLTMVGTFIVPTVLVEEKEKYTLRAILVSPASFADVIAGKALFGLLYAAVASGLLLALNGGLGGNLPVTLLALLLGSLFLVLVGLLMGAFFQSAAQVNTWSTLVMLLLLIPAMFTLPPKPPEPVATLAGLIPTSYLAHAVTLSMAGKATLATVGPDLVILAGSALMIFLLVLWRLRRERE